MKKIFLTAAMCFLTSFVFAREADDKNLSRFADVRTIESKFTMSKYLSIADEPLLSAGHFYFQRPDNLYWEYETPYSYGFVIAGGRMLSWQEKDGQKQVKDITSQPAAGEMAGQLYAFVSMDMDKLSRIYSVEPFDGGIILYPKNRSKKQMIRDIKIYFAEDIAAVREVVITERSGDNTVITFTDTKIDGQLPENAFTI